MRYSYVNPYSVSSTGIKFLDLFISICPTFFSCQGAGTEQVLNRYLLNVWNLAKHKYSLGNYYFPGNALGTGKDRRQTWSLPLWSLQSS